MISPSRCIAIAIGSTTITTTRRYLIMIIVMIIIIISSLSCIYKKMIPLYTIQVKLLSVLIVRSTDAFNCNTIYGVLFCSKIHFTIDFTINLASFARV